MQRQGSIGSGSVNIYPHQRIAQQPRHNNHQDVHVQYLSNSSSQAPLRKNSQPAVDYAYNGRIQTVGQKRARAFALLDEAELGWFHLRAVLVSGAGFFTDAYDIFVISQCLPMIYQIYYSSYVKGSYPARFVNASAPFNANYTYTPQQVLTDWVNSGNNKHLDALLKASTNWGNFIGQLLFGYLGDKLGRKRMYGIELMIMIFCTVCTAMAAPAARGLSIIAALSVWRFFLGIGIGGDYPMSAIITSEFANVRYRGMMIAAVFAMQGIGILIGGLVFVVTLLYMKPYIVEDFMNLDYVWRIALGTGVIPAAIALYFRLTIPETPRYTVDVVGDAEKAERDVVKVLALNQVRDVTSAWGEEPAPPTTRVAVKGDDFTEYFGQPRNLRILLGTAYSWFALDIAWYGLTLNQNTILSLINYNGPAKISGFCVQNGSDPQFCPAPFADPLATVFDYLYPRAVGNIIIACAGTVPGYWVAVLLIEKLGRKTIQFAGFIVLTVVLLVLAIFWSTISSNATYFVLLFTVAQFFFNFGPNTTTFVVPGEVFPTRWRSTGHGISAACGKVGAILGIQAVGPFFNQNPQLVLYVFSAVMLSGIFATFLIPETKGKTLEELSQEDGVFIDSTEVVYRA
ncbi:major facilitator superfamily domain-containing protein [Zopfochytrium polystomum]|nr:major facilitator superfamily domain-containing protein [Zopfochytrium polystomum]